MKGGEEAEEEDIELASGAKEGETEGRGEGDDANDMTEGVSASGSVSVPWA